MALYPAFGTNKTSTRLQRLEKGAQRIQRGSLRPTSGIFARIPASTLTQVGSNQKIDLSNSSVHKIGSTPPNSLLGNFAYVASADGTSITWYWDGTNGSVPIQLHRSDGSRFVVPGGSLAVTTLTASTTYYFLPFWNTSSLTVGWVKGQVGLPQVALVHNDTVGATANLYIIQQNLQHLEPLTGSFMSAATTAGGGGPGGGQGGDGGGFGRCVMAGTEIETLGSMPYVVKSYDEFNWLHIVDEDCNMLNCTLDHPLYHASEGRVNASDLAVGDLVITNRGEREIVEIKTLHKKYLKNEIHMQKGHLYWANGFLSHNVKIPF